MPALVPFLAVTTLKQSVLVPGSLESYGINGLLWTFIGILALIYATTLAALSWALLRRRARTSHDDGMISKVVVGATIATILILVILTTCSFSEQHQLYA